MEPEIVEQPTKDNRFIEITFKSISGLRPVYLFPLISLHVEFLGECILETEKVPFCETMVINRTVVLEFDYSDYSCYDKFISSPIVFTVTETEGPGDSSLLLPERTGRAIWQSEESILDLKEALLGTKNEEEARGAAKSASKKSSKASSRGSSKGSKGKVGKESKGSSKTGKGSKTVSKSKIQEGAMVPAAEPKPVGPQAAGTGVLDLLPLFLGERLFEESIVLKADTGKPMDDRKRAVARLPRIEVEVIIDNPIPAGKFYSITVESVYNLPSVMSQDMKYRMMVNTPTRAQQIPFNKYTYSTEHHKNFTNVKWYNSNIDSSYYLEDSFDNIKGSFQETIAEVLSKDVPRLEYNTIKRSYGCENDIDALKLHLQKYRSLIIEMYVERSDAGEDPKSTASQKGGKKSKEKDSKAGGKKGKGKDKLSSVATDDKKEEPEYLHLMVYINLCRLLYPDQKSVRVAAQLKTFNLHEATAYGGLEDSYFRPKPPPPPPPPPPKEEKADKGKKDKKGKDSSKSSKTSKSSKGSKKGKGGSGDLKAKLPPPPPIPEPSKLVFNEEGLPCVLVFQFDLEEPLVASRKMEDLSDELHTIIFPDGQINDLPKTIKSGKVTEEFYRDTIKSISRDIKCQYLDFIVETKTNREPMVKEKDFLAYLQHKGVYQTYLASLTRSTSAYVHALHHFDPLSPTADYYKFISKVYVLLVEKMHAVINELFHIGVDISKPIKQLSERLLKYGHESMELGATTLANRYFLQRICDDRLNPDYWFEYAVFQMHIGQKEKAIQCTIQAMKQQPMHRNSLVLYALMLAQKNRVAEAETCLLNVTLHNPMWVEGWGALYCVYMRRNNPEGMEVALQMAQKNLEVCKAEPIYDLSWTTIMVPNTVFYRTTCYFITMRLYAEAEMMLSNEILKSREAINDYLLAVISYYRKDYEHALLHIDNAFNCGGCDYTKCSLRGHIIAVQGEPSCALDDYKKIFQQFQKPENIYMYLVYIQSGLCYSLLGKDQDSRLAFLKACEIEGSPFTWLCAGVLYYHQTDYLSAEECLTQANSLDNRLPETWAYLALVNVKLRRAHEAQMCLHQAELHQFENEKLLTFTREEVNSLVSSVEDEQ